jgi:hypothetical protein
MQSPYSNPYLSMRARGLFAYYAELGRVVSAEELSAVMPEGRDSIQSAINELKQAGYILTAREQVNGKWNSYMKFTEGAKVLLGTDNGFSGHSISGHMYNCSSAVTSTSDISIVDSPIVEVLRTSTISRTASSTNERGSEMGWDLDGEEPKPKKKFKIDAEDDSVGAVGLVEDKKAKRQAKYGAVPNSVTHRSNKPEEDWSTGDIVSEFASLLSLSSAGHLTMQINTQHLAIWINKQVGLGATRQQLLTSVRMFFDDPRNLNDAGTGVPVWRRFVAKYQMLEGRAIEEKPDYEVNKAHQEKMLKLLGGK